MKQPFAARAVLPATAVAVAALLAGCDDRAEERPRPRESSAPVSAPPPPDGGAAAGHAADRPRVVVPDAERDPPRATILLDAVTTESTLARASQPGSGHPRAVALTEPRLRATTLGEDGNEGVARVRVSISERIACRAAGGRRFTRPRIRYHPPPQIERIRAAPGARLPATRTRSLVITVGTGRCGPEARQAEVRGELWGEAINGSGLEAVTPHIRFSFVPR